MKSKGKMTRTTMILSPNNEQPTAFPASLILLNGFRWEDLHNLRSAGVLLLCLRFASLAHVMDRFRMYDPRVVARCWTMRSTLCTCLAIMMLVVISILARADWLQRRIMRRDMDEVNNI